MRKTALMLLVLATVTVAFGDTCKVCKRTYTLSRLSRSSMSAIAKVVASRHGSHGDQSHMVEIARRESNFKPTTRNSRTSAYGLYGFLNSTWRGTGIKKTNCPYCQTEAAMRYIKARYGTVEKALAHHRRHGWY